MTKLAEHLNEHSLSDAEFAAKVDCDRSMISKIKVGKAKPSLDLALKISRETGISVEALFPLEDRSEPSPAECPGGASGPANSSSSPCLSPEVATP
ncbi:MAG: helix-turn-helix domain-containing protein [Mesorhizobium sp.]|uniref:helix-turn-helix transcriptional regulator n=3 Tax=Mesorhizobium TaxID=68287 RepID=UPI000FCC5497|nr:MULTISPECIES: helix-turn-helix transcriptional regulator [unclassified Mesorhizobium]RUV13558.1 helix-turn-helix domain-containing protein [Mesorhizobium sp. M1A.F.Ca.IN.022.04.1.1]RUV63514.1 helix-turn-helix domain-containing protein [Mesorhizobium sp. M1A.F.Ca.IN.022.02.1.1]TIN82680.1 MAG: helix-turn-helix domain-containing protein [Mesorhizobium sp.]TIQ88648.1 MAG: helix-turn-helix domain-containing protein [Mesorhizobium sp.]TIR00857.1 MAG: helix-turn-helix domain-containing protein [Me